jgi:hypothetical protein
MGPLQKSVRRLEPIKTFIEGMKRLPQLSDKLSDSQVETLLDELYRHAELKIQYDENVQSWQKVISEFRRARMSVLHIKKCIEQAADRFDDITKDNRVLLEYLDVVTRFQQRPTIFSVALCEIRGSLSELRETASIVEAMLAGSIHPAQRTSKENDLARLHNVSGGDVREYTFLRPKTPAIDHWFIGAAADCLERCEKQNHTRISGKDKIIASLFEMLGEPGRTEGSIAKELRRQKTQGRPCLDAILSPWPIEMGPDLLP